MVVLCSDVPNLVSWWHSLLTKQLWTLVFCHLGRKFPYYGHLSSFILVPSSLALSLHPSLILSQTGFFAHFLISDLFPMLQWALARISGIQNRLPFHNTGNQWPWRDGFSLSASSHASTPTCATQLPARVRVLKHWHHGEYSDNIEILSISNLSQHK